MKRKKEKMNTYSVKEAFVMSCKKYWQLYIMLIPLVIWLIIFWAWPLYGVQIAFRQYRVPDGFWGSRWVGLDHFKRFFNSFYLERTLKNTIGMNLYSLLAGFPLTLLLALVFNEMASRKYKSAAQLISYLPNFLSVMVIGGMCIAFFKTEGMVNSFVELFGGERMDFLGEPKYFWHVYVWSGIWQSIGFGTIMYTAAMSSISEELYDAAKIDGAGIFKRMWHVTLPGIEYVIVFNLIMSLGNMLSMGFEKIYLLQNNLNWETSEVIATYVYKQGIIGGQFSYTTAVGLFNTALNLALLMTANAIIKKIRGVGIW